LESYIYHVLLCYGESPALVALVRARQLQTAASLPGGTPPIKGHFCADANEQEVYSLDPTGANPPSVATQFQFDHFTAMADAALRALQSARNIGQAPLGTFLDQDDGNLLDGVIEYDPPQQPPVEPDPSGTNFMVASCQYPTGFIDEPVAYRSYGDLVERLG
jgi:hypothetical protein